MRKKVILFFIVLILFVAVLTIMRIAFLGEYNTFVKNNSLYIPNVVIDNSDALLLGMAAIIFIIVAGFILHKLEHHRHKIHSQLIEDKAPFRRKLIPIKLNNNFK